MARPSNWSRRGRPSQGPKGGVAAKTPSPLELEAKRREALRLWLRWNEAYQCLTEQMYQPGTSQERMQDMIDGLDQLRRTAIALSHEVLDQDPSLDPDPSLDRDPSLDSSAGH